MANYYVDDVGNNSNSGTADDSAWLTLDYADTQVSPGDAIFVMSIAEELREHKVEIFEEGMSKMPLEKHIKSDDKLKARNRVNKDFRNWNMQKSLKRSLFKF